MSRADMNAYWKKILGGKKKPPPTVVFDVEVFK
jgi:hypothetical protein